MSTVCEVQRIMDVADLPSDSDFCQWTALALVKPDARTEVLIRLVDDEESRRLNEQFRQKNKPTNVLSFPFEVPDGVDCRHLGDLVICVPLVRREAQEQNKPLMAHWAHMVIHGVLHLQGYDHVNEEEAVIMENLETELLKQLGYRNPYEIIEQHDK